MRARHTLGLRLSLIRKREVSNLLKSDNNLRNHLYQNLPFFTLFFVAKYCEYGKI